MSIDNKTRESRVSRWQALKSAWETKLAEADNENDKSVAAAMIDEAEGMIERLEKTDEVKKKSIVTKGSVDIPKKKVTKTDTYPHRDKDSTETIGTLGS